MALVFVLWIIFAWVLGKVAEHRGRSFWIWFFLGLIIDPILASLLYSVIVKKK